MIFEITKNIFNSRDIISKTTKLDKYFQNNEYRGVGNNNSENTNLAPLHYPQQELFICDIADAMLKNDMASMEHPFYTLSKRPVLEKQDYRQGEKFVTIIPSDIGLATIYDKDLLIYAISMLMQGAREGREVSPYIRIFPYDFFVFSNRKHCGGMSYRRFRDTLRRLHGTRIRTNVEIEGVEVAEAGFSLISDYYIERTAKTRRCMYVDIQLGPSIFKAINDKKVLTLNSDYFRIKKPLERRLYEIARKHCGKQHSWTINMDTLKRKTGSTAPPGAVSPPHGQ